MDQSLRDALIVLIREGTGLLKALRTLAERGLKEEDRG